MKKLLCRFVASRSVASLLSILALAALSFFVLDEAYATPPILGTGSMSNYLKSVATNTDLVCNFDDPQSTLLITEIESPPSFIMATPAGKVIICREKLHGTDPTWGSTEASWLSPEIAFTLTQIAMMPNFGLPNATSGLVVFPTDNGDGTTTVTWEFIVDNAGGSHTEILVWNLAPQDPTNARFNDGTLLCQDPSQPAGVLLNPCINRIGVPASPKVSDFPDRDLDGDNINDFGADGVVFRYTELVRLSDGRRLPRTLLFGPCHTGSFNINDPIVCQQTINKQVYQTRTAGNIPGVVPVQVDIQPNSFNVGSQGTNFIRIFGQATLSPPPISTLLVNGTPITPVSISFGDINGDGFLDYIAKVDRVAFGLALGCPSPTGATLFNVVVTGTFNDPNATPFRGENEIVTCF